MLPEAKGEVLLYATFGCEGTWAAHNLSPPLIFRAMALVFAQLTPRVTTSPSFMKEAAAT